jgi:hypothetical protein
LASTSTTRVGYADTATNITAYTINQNLGTSNSPTFAGLTINGTITATQLTIQYTTITTTLVQTDDIIQTTNNTSATSTTTGALIVAGGAGVGGSIYAGGRIYSAGSQILPTSIQEFTATAGQTTFTISGGYTVGSVQVFANGVALGNTDITASNGTTVVLTTPRAVGDIIRIIAGIASPGTNISSLQAFSVAMSVALGS